VTSDTPTALDTHTARPQRADARRNRARILEAAEAVFASRGSGAGIDDVATEAGLGVGTLYRHFPTKEALISAILFERIHRLIGAGETYLEVEDPADGLYQFLTHLVDEAVAKQDLTDALAGWTPPEEPPA
jgi:AcrR family transcriptional regulator